MSETSPDLDSTVHLLARIRGGEEAARDHLLARYLPVLTRWASGRLPARARGLVETDDLVQSTLIRTLRHLEEFEPQHDGAFLVYLRRALMNAMRDEIRRAARTPGGAEVPESLVDAEPSPVEQAIGSETLARYEAALARLTPEQQEAVVLRVEMGLTYEQMAEAMGKPSWNAARMFVTRALAELAEAMDERG